MLRIPLHRVENVAFHRRLIDLSYQAHGRVVRGGQPPMLLLDARYSNRLSRLDPTQLQPLADDG